jgi:ornithine carbamoyltransferase
MYDLYGDGIGVRVLDEAVDFVYGSGRRVVQQVAETAKVPVINMGCCTYHPTQAIGDMMTVQRRMRGLKGKKYAITWAYSSKMRGRCSIQEELLIATRFGMDVVLAHPNGFEIDPEIIKSARKNARDSGGSFEVSHDFEQALDGANVAFSRSWVTSNLSRVGASAFGMDKELKIHKKHTSWRLKQKHVEDLMDKSAIVTHVLPVFRGEEATADVIDGPNSVIYEQAEDNFYAKMAVLSLTMARDASYKLE